MAPLRPALVFAFVTLAMGCDAGPQAVFETEALPVLERRCLTPVCHGVASGEAPPSVGLFVQLDARGLAADPVAAREVARSRITTTAPATLSSLVRAPLAGVHGGGPHAGGALFLGPQDPALEALARWIDAEPEGSGGEDVSLEPLEERFGREVLPILVRRCGFAGCHGPREIANTAIPAHRDPETGAFAPLDVRRAHRAMRRHLDLWGADVMQSRLVRKARGPGDAGIVHRGGPQTFFPDELDVVLDWARAERQALGVEEGREPSGLVWVRQPVGSRTPYGISPEAEGSDLFWSAWPMPSGSAAENLSAGAHPEGPAEVRDPAVSHDGLRVTFAMRRGGEQRFALYELELATRTTRRLTTDSAPGSFVQPVYGPDGRVVAVTDGYGPVGEGGAPELVAIDPSGELERLTYTLAPEVRPATLASGKTRGMLVFGVRRGGPLGPEGLLFRFPLCHDPALHGEPEYHAQFGATIAPRAPLVARDLPDGRQLLLVLASTDASDDRGALAILDRSLGPVLRDGDPPSVGGYSPAVSWLDTPARWRDPVPLPDGTFLASSDADRTDGEDALVRVWIADGPDGSHVTQSETLLAETGLSLRSAALVIARPLEDDGHTPVVDPSLDDARIAIRDATILEALYGRTAPTGVRTLREDLASVRVLVPARTEGLGGEGARILATAPLAADHSAELRIPARTPIFLQWIDRRGMIVGNQLDRWFYGEGGELVPAGTNPPTYAHSCAPCHGSLSGDPDDATGPEPDAISAASATLSTHQDRDRRRPIAPLDVRGEGLSVTFEHDIAPLLEMRCVRCHDASTAAGSLVLERAAGARFDAGYEALIARGLVDPLRHARRSVLIERLLGEELDAEQAMLGRCPPEGLTSAELALVVQWIESGAAYREVSDGP